MVFDMTCARVTNDWKVYMKHCTPTQSHSFTGDRTYMYCQEQTQHSTFNSYTQECWPGKLHVHRLHYSNASMHDQYKRRLARLLTLRVLKSRHYESMISQQLTVSFCASRYLHNNSEIVCLCISLYACFESMLIKGIDIFLSAA